jgi:hypothetical protein
LENHFPPVAFLAFVKKNNPHIRVLAGFLEFYVLKYVTKFTSILRHAFGEGQICRILANRAIFRRIFHTNRKGGFYGVFRYRQGNLKGKRSLKRAYFPLYVRPLIFQVSLNENK